MTQSRPEGAARLHTPKTCSTLSSADDSKQNRSNRAGVSGRGKRGERGRGTGVFSVSVTSMTQIFHRLQKSPRWSRSSTGNSLVWNSNGGRADVHMRTFGHIYTRGIHMQNGRHRVNHTRQINTLTQPVLESEMRIWGLITESSSVWNPVLSQFRMTFSITGTCSELHLGKKILSYLRIGM